MTFVSIPELQMADDIKKLLSEKNLPYSETSDMASAFAEADIVYWTRLQKERLEATEKFDNGAFVITAGSLKALPKNSIIMHPLPRVDEIAAEVDADPRAKYFEQAGNGLYTRMALLEYVLE
jgi:aspartate carbamoyltransferase catalytic subunit